MHDREVTPDPVVLVLDAARFAAEKHARQRRKDARQTPYINHLIEVAHLLASAGADANLVAAGFLHDTVEDQGVTQGELRERFGEDVAALVRFATDDKSLPRHQRKSLQVEHAASARAREADLKLADKISNLTSIRDNPPTDWSEARIVQYIAWAHAVVSKLNGVAPALQAQYEHLRASLLERFPEAATADPVYSDAAAD